MKNKKKPKIKNNPSNKKIPRIDPRISTDPLQLSPSWQFEFIDIDGPWGWNNIDKDYLLSKILKSIINFESMKWREILNRNNHEIEKYRITKQAQKRLTELNMDDIESLVSLRIMGAVRIWGIRVHNCFKVLWWDPEHQVYPSKLKHT